MIRSITPADASAIAAIYNPYVAGSTVTFEEQPVSDEEMAARIAAITAEYPYLVCEEAGKIVGYCYAHRWKERSAFRHTAETAVYLLPEAQGRGIGTALMQALAAECKMQGIRALVACITDGNTASFALHEKLGFKRVSHFEQVGVKFGRRLDVVDYELLLD